MKRSLSKFACVGIAVWVLMACGGGSGSSSSSSAASSATNCKTTTVTLSSGLPPGMTALSGLSTNYVTSVTAGSSNVVIVTKDVPTHASPYCSATQTVTGCTNESTSLSSPNYYNNLLFGSTTYSQNPYFVHVGSGGLSTTMSYTITIPLQPACASTSTSTSQDAIGIAKNGIVFFNQYAAGNAVLSGEVAGFDRYGGHPAQSGNYHYHVEPRYLTTSTVGGGTGTQSSLIGWALDGFPVYGPTNSSGTAVSLDACNGEYHATTEYPAGIYHYHVTNSSPYLLGCYAGTPGTKVLTP